MQNQSSLRFVALFMALVFALSNPVPSHGQDAAATATASGTTTAANPAPVAPDATPAPFFFQDGDTPAVFLGDSITEQRLYTTLIETYTLTRFPTMKITFRNAGWSGDTAWLQKRGNDFDYALKRDVLDLKAKAVTIDFGMNDARGGDSNFVKYLDSTTKLVKGIEKGGARVLLLTPSPEERYEANQPAGSAYNLILKKYADGLKQVADNEKIPLIDQYTPFVAYIEAGRKAGVLSTEAPPGDPNVIRLTGDGVHPNWGGHLIMASIILQGMHAPADVSSVTIDADQHSIIASQGCQVDWQNAPAGTVIFKRKDDALPWPIPVDPRIDTVMKIPGFDPATTLNQYGLKVVGLKEAAYMLFIDDQNVGSFPSADLANGVNLGFMRVGPIYDQGQQLLKAVITKNDAYFARWRNVQLYEVPDWLKEAGTDHARTVEITRLDAVIADSEKNIETLRKPVQRTFKLVPVPK